MTKSTLNSAISFLKNTRIFKECADLGEELKQYDKKIVFIGHGSVLCYEKLCENIRNCEVADERIRYVHGSSVGFVAEDKIKNGEELINSANLVPFYLRLPQAERELKLKK